MSDTNDFNQQTIDEFRANKGKVGGPFAGAPMVVLHHTGAKSGVARVNPLMYQAVDGGWAIFASKAGAPDNPDWFYNLKANPETTIEIGEDIVDVVARVANDDEREPIWTKQKQEFPNFAVYETLTDRKIPVVILERR